MLDVFENEGFQRIDLPSDFDDKFEQAIAAIMNPKKPTITFKNGTPIVQCDSDWKFYNSSKPSRFDGNQTNNTDNIIPEGDNANRLVTEDLTGPSLNEYI